MVKEERFEIILKELKRNKTVTYETFADIIPVSEDTIRRDIDYLYRNGLISKVRGGAMLRSKDPLSFKDRSTYSKNEKSVIALKAQKFVQNGMTIFMDGGTTVCAVASHFPVNISLRIITNNIQLIPIIAQFKNIELIILGGTYHQDTGTLLGVETCTEAGNYFADIYFMGTCAVDHKLGISAVFKADAEVKKVMALSTKKIVALADQNKLRRTETFKVASIDSINVLITDLASDNEELNDFRNLDLQLL